MFLWINGKVVADTRKSPDLRGILVLLAEKLSVQQNDFMQLKMFLKRQRKMHADSKKSSAVSSFFPGGRQ